MHTRSYQGDVVIVGAGIAGIVTALELLDRSRHVVLLDRDTADHLGGLAPWSFGGLFFVGTPEQKRLGIRDTPDLALRDWHAFAEFEPGDDWPRRWAEQYVHGCTETVYRWLRDRGITFFPVVHWVERGLFVPGNSVPRFHMVWGTGRALMDTLIGRLRHHPNADRLHLCTGHRVTDLLVQNGAVTGVRGTVDATGEAFEARGEATVIAAGGICGSIERLRRHWYPAWGTPPETILNGAHPYADGTLHDAAERHGAHVTHLDKQWLYAAGVHHPCPRHEGHGLSLVPPRSALWVNYRGERLGPPPLVTGFDTRYLVEQICRQEKKYSWQILNRTIARKELAVSGSEFNDAIREKRWLGFLKTVLLGNEALVQTLIDHGADVVVAGSLPELAERMNALTGTDDVDAAALADAVGRYDAQIERGPAFFNDDQLRRIAHLRRYRGDRVRTCAFQKIVDPKAMPLIAIRAFILSRKSLGGLQTDLDGRVLRPPRNGRQEAIAGLFAVGEAAGFGGGGLHGRRALEGTFLGACIFTARRTAQALLQG
ncbi:FAD-binding dehydrogenase [Rhodothermaceae bacterium RA]|nr:FAD-binding dehydrogenase [Rhodothermaceae bacterium RA]